MSQWIQYDGNCRPEALELDLIELFAGRGRIAKAGAHLGWKSRAFELAWDQGSLSSKGAPRRSKTRPKSRSFMDINSSAGLAFLGTKSCSLQTCRATLRCHALRLVVAMLLQQRFGQSLTTIAAVCSS